MRELLIYIILINVFGFILSAYDKNSAIRNRRRTRESTLWLAAFIGGAAGLYISMRIFRHKTKHRSFMIGIPLIILVQAASLCYIAIKLLD